MVTKISGGTVVSGGSEVRADVYLRGGSIEAVTAECLPCDREISADGCYVSAGFIDLHVHGGGGADVMDGGAEPILTAARCHLAHGTTTLYPTSVCTDTHTTMRFLADMEQAQARAGRQGVPNLPGVHLEGPYLSQMQCGAQDPAHIRPPDPAEYMALIARYGGLVKRWSYAPELPGAAEFDACLAQNGIVRSIAHSNALHEDVQPVYDAGCRLLTHFYSGMSMLTRENGYRRLGVVESGYLLDDMSVELICDGRHLPVQLLQLVYKAKGPRRICLVTDAMRAAGTAETTSVLGPLATGLRVVIEDGVAKTPDRQGFAGSVATADLLLKTAREQMEAPLPQAVAMLTEVPARLMGLRKKGLVQAGMDADLVLFDGDVSVRQVVLGGEPVL